MRILWKLVWVSICFCLLLKGCARLDLPPRAAAESVSPQAPAVLELKLILDKAVYSPDEPIRAIFILKNTGSVSVLLPDHMVIFRNLVNLPPGGMIFTTLIKEPEHAGMPVGPWGFASYARPVPLLSFTELRPGESLQISQDLCLIYRLFPERSNLSGGEYRLSAIYQNKEKLADGRETWLGRVESNEVVFSIEAEP